MVQIERKREGRERNPRKERDNSSLSLPLFFLRFFLLLWPNSGGREAGEAVAVIKGWRPMMAASGG